MLEEDDLYADLAKFMGPPDVAKGRDGDGVLDAAAELEKYLRTSSESHGGREGNGEVTVPTMIPPPHHTIQCEVVHGILRSPSVNSLVGNTSYSTEYTCNTRCRNSPGGTSAARGADGSATASGVL